MDNRPLAIGNLPAQIDIEVIADLRHVETATVGHSRLTGFMDRSIRAVLPRKRIAGTAVTVSIAGPDSTLLHHALSLVRPGDILVVDRHGDDRFACWGGGVTVAAQTAGIEGGIVDGPFTDLSEIEESDFPLWARGPSAITTRLYNLGGTFCCPISCGGVVVNPGDAILADESGVLVIPPTEVKALIQNALEKQTAGLERQARVRAGEKLADLSGATAQLESRFQSPAS